MRLVDLGAFIAGMITGYSMLAGLLLAICALKKELK